jgi:hypothetical protein
MLSTLLVIGGVLVGLLLLLALIVGLSARPATTSRRSAPGRRTATWEADAGLPHPDAWSEPRTTSTELPAVR